MGYSKPMLPFGPELMLQRVLRVLKPIVSTRIIVAARNQILPQLPPEILVAHDERDGRGPLEGLLAGMSNLPESIECVFVTSCDVPLLRPELVRHLFELCSVETQVVVPKEDRFHHPLTAIYRTNVRSEIESLLDDGQLRPRQLFDRVQTLEVNVDTLKQFDPQLDSFRNLNHPIDYRNCLKDAGFELDPKIRMQLE